MIRPVSSGCIPWSPTSSVSPEHLDWMHSDEMPEPPQLAPYDRKEQRLYSELPRKTRVWRFICAIFPVTTPKAHGQRWGSACRGIGWMRSSAFRPSAFPLHGLYFKLLGRDMGGIIPPHFNQLTAVDQCGHSQSSGKFPRPWARWLELSLRKEARGCRDLSLSPLSVAQIRQAPLLVWAALNHPTDSRSLPPDQRHGHWE